MYFSNGHALIIGIANYAKVSSLPKAVINDAEDLTSVIKSPDYCGYNPENIKLLLDSQATADAIRNELSSLIKKAQEDDTVLIFFSGHGHENKSGTEAGNYLLPFDCDLEKIASTAIAGDELTAFFRQIKSKRLLVIFDCCFAGGAGMPKKTTGFSKQVSLKPFSEETYEKLAQGRGSVIIASSRSNQVSNILGGERNSIFTQYLLEALQGKSSTYGDGFVRVFDLFHYVSEKVPARADQNPIFKTAPDFENNFPVALWQGGKKMAVGSPERLLIPTQVNTTELRKQILSHYELSEFRILCDDINQDFVNIGDRTRINLDNFEGGLEEKVARLIRFLSSRKRLAYLVAAVRREHPEII